MEYDGYDEIVRAWIQGVYDSRGNDAKRTLKFCYDIEQYAMKKNDPKLLGFAYYYSAETYYLLNESEKFFFCISKGVSYLNAHPLGKYYAVWCDWLMEHAVVRDGKS